MDREKRQSLRSVARVIVVWISEAVGLVLMVRFVPGLRFDSWGIGILVVGVIALLNAILWPILSRIALPFLFFTFGIGALALNGLIVWLSSLVVPGFHVEGWALILVPIGIAVINTAVSGILTIDDDARYFSAVLLRHAKRSSKTSAATKPGVIFLEIDGCSEFILREAMRRGYMPTLAGWLKKGSHKLRQWETDLSSQTGASQAGILHGNNSNMPAFRWVEKENENKMVASNGPSDAPLLEKRISNGKGLLATNGASRSNLFSGDAQDVIFTYSKFTDLRGFYTKAWYFFYSNPYNFPRTLALYCWDILSELRSQLRHRMGNVQPRIHRGPVYLAMRATTNVFMREITTYAIVGDIIAGQVDALYATYMGYDEIAHHNGVADHDAFLALRQLDKHFARLEKAGEFSSRKYKFVILSDHGQSNGAPFRQRYGLSLKDLVQRLLPETFTIHSHLDTNQDHFGHVVTAPFENGQRVFREGGKRLTRRVKGTIFKDIAEHRRSETLDEKAPSKNAHVIVLASGNLGLVYFTQWKERMTYEQLNKAFPDLIPGLAKHEGIGFILVRSEKYGPLVIGAKGIYHLADNSVEGENPLSDFGPHAADHIRRTDGFKYAPDILVNSFYDPESDEVAAFEELVGSHGGLGGNQSKPFLMTPSEWDFGGTEIVGAETLHKVLKVRLEQF
ncbi:MAG: phage holin family protein [Candidatus Bathyarchaeia archaeon]|jgi:putative membrane protein